MEICNHTRQHTRNYDFVHVGEFDQAEIEKIMEEGLKMKKFEHIHVMNLIGVCLDAGPAPYIVMPYMANGSLLSYLKRKRVSLVLHADDDSDQVCKVFENGCQPPLVMITLLRYIHTYVWHRFKCYHAFATFSSTILIHVNLGRIKKRK